MNMNKRDALKVLDLPTHCTFEDIKKAYRIACSKYHPDRNSVGLEMMKIVNAAYQALSDYDSSSIENESNFNPSESLGEELNNALNAIIHLGLTIEICGSWIWVSGDTRSYKEILKEAGFKWAPKKLMWSFSGSEKRSFSRGKYSIDEIRLKHGSVNIKNRTFSKLSAA